MTAGDDRAPLRDLIVGGSRQVVAALVGLLTFPLITRLLDADQLGAWSLIGQASFLLALSDLGLTTAVQRAAVSSEQELARRTVGLALLVNLALLPLLAGGAFVALLTLPDPAPGLHAEMTWAAVVALIGGSLGALVVPYRGFAFARGGANSVARARTLGSVLFLLVLATAFSLGARLLAPALALAASQGLELALMLRLARRLDPELVLGPRWPTSGAEALRAFRDGAAGFSIGIASMLQTGIDAFVLSAFLPLSVVGAYRIGLRAPELAYLLAKQSTTPLLPRLGSPSDRARTLRVSTTLFGGLVTSGMAALAFAGQPLLVLWLGPKAEGVVPATVLMLMCFAMMVLSMYESAGATVILGARTAWAGAAPVLAGTAVNLAISLGGVRTYGVWAVAGSTPVGYLVTGLLVWVSARRVLGWSLREVASCLAAPLGAGAVSIAAALALRSVAAAGALASLAVCIGVSVAGTAVALGLASTAARWRTVAAVGASERTP